MQSELFVQAQPVMGTMISFQNEFSGNSVEAMVLSGGNNNSHGTNVMWQEMKLDSLLPLRDNNKKSSIDPSTMWLKPKSGENRTEYINNAPGENEQRVNSEQDANLTRMPSCDDNNQNGMKDNGCYMPDDNFQQQNNDSYTVQGFDREHQVALLNSYMPPVYEGMKVAILLP